MTSLLDLEPLLDYVFDFHRHPVEDLNKFEKNLKKYRIKSFCLEGDFEDPQSYIDKIKPYVKKYADAAIIFGLLDFSMEKSESMEFLKKQEREINIRGVKIHPAQGLSLKKSILEAHFSAIREVLGTVPIYVHMDWPLRKKDGYAPRGKKKTFNRISSQFPDFSIIMGHAGGSGDYLDVWKACKKYPNVMIETSMAPTTSPLEEVIWKLGPERLLFGTNYPYCSPSVELVKIQSLIKTTDRDRKLILKTNAEAIFS